MTLSRFLALTAASLCAASPLIMGAASPTDAAAGRDVTKRFADAIVGVEMVVTLKLKAGDREIPPSEQRIEVNGTMISASGLVVTSLAQVDPQASFDAARNSGRGGRAELVGVDFKEVKLRTADGKELPARFVLKDADLDLAFMAPEAATDGSAAPTFGSFVNLAESTDGALLDTYMFVTRAAKALQRVPLVRSTEVMGVVERPRKFYLVTDQSVGSPVFDFKGRILGISLQNISGGRSTTVVLPASDIAEMAKQAAAAQAKPAP